MMVRGKPWIFTTLSKNARTTSCVVVCTPKGTKRIILENLSTTTRRVECESHVGMSVRKSIAMSFQGESLTGIGYNNPLGLVCSVLVL